MTKIHIANDVGQMAERACGWLTGLILKRQFNEQRAFSLALAGGSTPRVLYQLLANNSHSSGIDWSRVLFLWGDERNVPPDHADSNYRMAREALLDHLPIRADQVLSIPTDGGDAIKAAMAYEHLLHDRLEDRRNNFGIIDCVLLGMGDDVHTASLFPQTKALEEASRWVVANYVAKLETWRVTLTAPIINSARSIAFFIAGASKTAAFNTLLHGPVNHDLYPSQMIRPFSGDLTYFVDQAAINGLTIPSDFEVLK